ncbi:MAG: P-II family nitrogen regulator, partial [Firmicutes bacterium]|nr:P-II family nitrogen regulator [Bacillota bacterium]
MGNPFRDLAAYETRVLTLILSESKSRKCIRLLREKGIRSEMTMIGRGTVSSAILNLLGISSQVKEIGHFLLDQEQITEILDYLDREFHLKKPGHGIAYVTAARKRVGPPVQGRDKPEVTGSTAQDREDEIVFRKLTVIVDRGMADEVMDIAREAGVKGGTILHGRGVGA